MMNPAHGNFNCNPVEDPKVRFRHHSLLQDYQELHMDTEAMRKRLETMQERKATLMAEVRFLRRRYRHLRQDQPVKKVRGRSNGGKKSKTQLVRVEVSPNKTSGAETKHVSLPDLNHSGEAHHDETKTKKVPLFDLNQISGEEEEEMNNSEERMRVEQSSACKRMSSIEMLSCRNGGDGSHKRKSSWQDPVAALRV
ncbi:hypothetical protein Bca4012_048668 [Brassica carinata]|uniref:Uncharacterized protein n=5 Tax=Brassica TaxID=3705 RepID=A0A0D3ALC4_BRAOL|nr:PREDICTED: uncharacterized protein LOC106324932 [Brassica oleracea var. oleracea]KAG2310828.1 hypothetical protein Bca52824_022385 [Brassica carinata]CAF1892483.1 unnamed protein product [Brassica napus]VDD20970.1 unnamed protein product [Brassica oleracea]